MLLVILGVFDIVGDGGEDADALFDPWLSERWCFLVSVDRRISWTPLLIRSIVVIYERRYDGYIKELWLGKKTIENCSGNDEMSESNCFFIYWFNMSQVTRCLIHTSIPSGPSFAQFRMHLDAASTLFRRIWSIDKTKLRTLRKALIHLHSTPKITVCPGLLSLLLSHSSQIKIANPSRMRYFSGKIRSWTHKKVTYK